MIHHAPGPMAGAASLPQPFYCLGRPMAALIPWTPPEFEWKVGALIGLCLERRACGGRVVIGAGWPYESAVFRLLAVAATRLRRSGLSVAVCGTSYCALAAPARPKADIAILLEAPGYAALDPWLETRRGQAVVLVGPEADWRLGADLPIDFLAEGADPGFPDRAARHAGYIRDLWKCADPEVRSALLLNALGCDVSQGFLSESGEAPFLAVGDDDLLTLPGQWLVWQAIAPFADELNETWERDATRRAPPPLLERAGHRLALRQTSGVLEGDPLSLNADARPTVLAVKAIRHLLRRANNASS